MANTCTLSYGATTVTLPPVAGVIMGQAHIPSSIMQCGDGAYGYVFGASWFEFTVEWNALTKAQIVALQNFYTTTVKGASIEWTFTRQKGNTATCQFMEPPDLEHESESGDGLHKASIRIRASTTIIDVS